MWGGSIRFTTSMLFAIAFLFTFTIGGLSGVTFATVPIDWQVTDSYYVVAHMHYVLFGGTLFGVMAGIYYWFPKMSGRLLSERWGAVHFWLMFIGFHMTFFIQHFLGLDGMPRRVYTYPDHPGWAIMNLISTIGAFVIGISVLVLLANIVVSLRTWRARRRQSLECVDTGMGHDIAASRAQFRCRSAGTRADGPCGISRIRKESGREAIRHGKAGNVRFSLRRKPYSSPSSSRPTFTTTEPLFMARAQATASTRPGH